MTPDLTSLASKPVSSLRTQTHRGLSASNERSNFNTLNNVDEPINLRSNTLPTVHATLV